MVPEKLTFSPLSRRQIEADYLRTSDRSDSRHSWAILALLVRFIRQYWPDTRIVLRGDSHFCRPRMLNWCDRHHVDYIVGIAKNSRLLKEVDVPMMLVRKTQWQVGGQGKRMKKPTPRECPPGRSHPARLSSVSAGFRL